MARFCNNCGQEIPDGTGFCNACGTPVDQPAQQAAPAVQPAPVQQPQQAAPVQQTQAPQIQPAGQFDGSVSTGYFFGMMLVYALPIVGWIACIVTAFKSKHQTKKHFAKAMMIWLIIGLILSLITGVIITWLGTLLVDYINDLAAAELGEMGEIGEFQDLLDQLQQYDGGETALPAE